MWLKKDDFVYNLNEDTVDSIYITVKNPKQFDICVNIKNNYISQNSKRELFNDSELIIISLDNYEQAKSYLNTLIRLIQCKHIIVDSLLDTIKQWMS